MGSAPTPLTSCRHPVPGSRRESASGLPRLLLRAHGRADGTETPSSGQRFGGPSRLSHRREMTGAPDRPTMRGPVARTFARKPAQRPMGMPVATAPISEVKHGNQRPRPCPEDLRLMGAVSAGSAGVSLALVSNATGSRLYRDGAQSRYGQVDIHATRVLFHRPGETTCEVGIVWAPSVRPVP